MTTKERNILIRKIAHAVRAYTIECQRDADQKYKPTVTSFKQILTRKTDNQLLMIALQICK